MADHTLFVGLDVHKRTIAVATDDMFIVPEETTTVLDVVANDTYAGQKADLAVQVISQGLHGTATVRGDKDIDFAAGTVSQNEADSFTYRITDSFGTSNTATASLTVQNVGGGGGGDDGFGGTLIYHWEPLAAWIDGVPLANRDTGDIHVDGKTSWWIDGANPANGGFRTGHTLVKGLNATGSQASCAWNRAPTGHPSLEVRSGAGQNGSVDLGVTLWNYQITNPRRVRVVAEVKTCKPTDPTTFKGQGIGTQSGSYPDWRNTANNPDTQIKYFLGQRVSNGGGACQTNWYAREPGEGGLTWHRDRSSERIQCSSGGKTFGTYSYQFGRGTPCGSQHSTGAVRYTDTNVYGVWHKIECEIHLTNPALNNGTWGTTDLQPTGGDGRVRLFVTPDIDGEGGSPGSRILAADEQNMVWHTSQNNYHQILNLSDFWIILFHGGQTPSAIEAWSWIRKVQVYHYTEDDI